MQSDMNLPTKFLSFEEDAFCKFYSNHANDKSLELREKISKNLSVLINNNINELEFTDAGDIKLRERDVKQLVQETGDESTRFQKNARDIEKFIKFIGDFKGIINKEEAVSVNNYLMVNASNPFLDDSVKTPLMNARDVVQEKFIDTREPEILYAKLTELSIGFKNTDEVINFLNDILDKTFPERLKKLQEEKSNSELIDKEDYDVGTKIMRGLALVPPLSVLFFGAVLGPIIIGGGGPLAVLAILGPPLGLALLVSAILLVVSFLGEPTPSAGTEEIEARINNDLKNANIISKVKKDIADDPKRFKNFHDKYGPVNKTNSLWFNLYYHFRVSEALKNAEDGFLTIQEKQKIDLNENNANFANLKSMLH